MASEVWKIGQETSANDLYKNITEKGYVFCRSETFAVSKLTEVCQSMINDYAEVISDQNEYFIEIDEIITNAENTQNDIQERIETLLNEIAELKKKEEKGTITEDEKKELKYKSDEFKSLRDLLRTTEMQDNDEIRYKNEERKSNNRGKAEIATDYAETTIEKGQPLADTKVSHGFFKKLFGNTGSYKKEIGNKALEVGNNLLNKVSESYDIQKRIDKRIK